MPSHPSLSLRNAGHPKYLGVIWEGVFPFTPNLNLSAAPCSARLPLEQWVALVASSDCRVLSSSKLRGVRGLGHRQNPECPSSDPCLYPL